MKNFDKLYNSYLKSIIKEDPDEDPYEADDIHAHTDGDPELKELQEKYVGKSLVERALHYYPDANPISRQPKVDWKSDFLTIESIDITKKGTYKIHFSWDFFDKEFNTLDELKKKLETFDNPVTLETGMIDGRGEWYSGYKVYTMRKGWLWGYVWTDKCPTSEEFQQKMKDWMREKADEQRRRFNKFENDLGRF